MSRFDREKQIDEDLQKTSTWLLFAFLLGWGALFCRFIALAVAGHKGGTSSTWFSQMCAGFLWTLAWLAAGYLFGFIFGVPKVIPQAVGPSGPPGATPVDGNSSSSRLKVNTNLEDISDWLTKVLVGATLTQIVKIPGAIGEAASYMSVGDTNPAAVSFNAAILLYYSALGFLSGYILTRMFFARAFALADQDPGLSNEIADTLEAASVELGRTLPNASNDPSLRKAAIASAAVPITNSLSGSEALLLAKGATLTGDASRALRASELAMEKNPDDPMARLTYAWALRKLGAGFQTVLPFVEAAAQRVSINSDVAVLSSVYNSLAYLWLYQPPPEGYERALHALAQYDEKNRSPNSDVEINRASAYGQKYKYLSSLLEQPTVASEDKTKLKKELEKARDEALKAIEKSLSVDPSSAARLKELLWVTGAITDDDLAVFQSDSAFTSLLPRI